uniref:GSKIP domain-containing protein n=1 Tax=Schistocephalus solidus TaxID=70667 RepID=A0A0X3NM82_SCHSO
MSIKPTDGGECPLKDAHEPMKFPPLHFATDPENKLCTVEAEAAVTETAFAVRDIRISEALPFNESLAYLNLTTLEGESLCVQINANGFQPIGVRYDEVNGRVPPPESGGPTPTNHTVGAVADDDDDDDERSDEDDEEAPEVYETIYALLSARSPGFRDRFSQRLTERLTELQAQVDASSGTDA